MDGLRVINYYTNPEHKDEPIVVFPELAANSSFGYDAPSFQEVMRDAWVAQYRGIFTPDEIAQTADPTNVELVEAQANRLKAASPSTGVSYVRTEMRHELPDIGEPFPLAGIGKAVEIRRRFQADLADVSNIFVTPSRQNRGYGSAMLHSLLDVFPDDTPTAVYELAVNRPTLATLGRYAFKARKTWKEPYFGGEQQQTWFTGPAVGDLRALLEAKRPWLADRDQGLL